MTTWAIEGELNFWEQEGGFRALEANLNGEPVAEWMAECVGLRPVPGDRGGNVTHEGLVRGRYRLTFERIDV